MAAAEISILSALGTTYEQCPLNISAKHAMWYLFHPVSEKDDPQQAGEGKVLSSYSVPEMYYSGGRAATIAEIFTTGAGPVEEELFPYRGKTGMLELDLALHDPEKWKENYIRYTKNVMVSFMDVLTKEEFEAYEADELDSAIMERAEAEANRQTEEDARRRMDRPGGCERHG